jgi:glycosyltransferase involved in cell wall biosynthesis
MWDKNFIPSASTLVLVAALNEGAGIGPTLAEIKQNMNSPRLLVVDGHSLDETAQVAKNFGADVLFQEGQGKGDAIKYALAQVDGDFDYVVLTDADYTYPAEFIPSMIKILDENPRVGMVCGNRFNSRFHLKGMKNVFYIGNRILALTHNFFNDVNLRDPLTGLRVIRWGIMKGWVPKSSGFDIEVELNVYVEKQGYQIEEIEIPYRIRIGEKKLKLKHGATILKRMIRLGFW